MSNQYVHSENCSKVSYSSTQISHCILCQSKQNSAEKPVETFSWNPFLLSDKLAKSVEDDIFDGVSYKRNARNYLNQESGLDIHSRACLTFKEKMTFMFLTVFSLNRSEKVHAEPQRSTLFFAMHRQKSLQNSGLKGYPADSG